MISILFLFMPIRLTFDIGDEWGEHHESSTLEFNLFKGILEVLMIGDPQCNCFFSHFQKYSLLTISSVPPTVSAVSSR